MLKVTPLRTSNPAEYYLEVVARGAEEYYVHGSQTPGRWIGSGAAGLELRGAVRPSALGALLEQRHPVTREQLSVRKVKRPGFDLTLSAPKSVSVLWGLREPAAAAAVEAAHRAAVNAAVDYLEQRACFVRRGGRGGYGVEHHHAGGLLGAAFTHFTSREGDPQLHTHVVIANMAQGPDGRYTALDGTALFVHRRAAGFLYQAVLRGELQQRLGVDFEPVHKGAADVAGVSPAARRLFSKRRTAIEKELARTGASGERAAQKAALKTRRAKDRSTTLDELRGRWNDEAARAGIPRLSTPVAVTGRTIPSEAEIAHVLATDTAVFDRAAVVAAVAAAHRQGASAAELDRCVEDVLASPLLVSLDDNESRWTTTEILELERAAAESAHRRRAAGAGLVPEATLTSALRNHSTLSNEQAAMARRLCSSGSGVEVVVGAPGSGKTFALGAARLAWRRSGHDVIGCSLAARAAAGLEADSGISSSTIARLQLELDNGRRRLTERTVVVCDEAAMVGTRDLARLVDAIGRAGAKLVLVGDPKQLPPIEAGGLYPALARRLGATELLENRRQRDPQERRALADLRRGNTSDVIARLDRLQRISTDADPDRLLDRMVDHWHDSRRAGKDTVMLGLTRDAVHELNQRAREQLQDAGELGPTVAEIEGTGVDFAIGDKVVCLRNDAKLQVRNGDTGTVIGATEAGLVLELQRGAVEIPADYLADGHLAHGYALTVHKAQGATYDIALLLGDHHLYAEAGYTALTRGSLHNHAYVLIDEGREAASPGEQLRRRLDRSAMSPAAIDVASLGR